MTEITVKKETLIRQQFHMVLQKLTYTPLKDRKAAYWMGRINSKLKTASLDIFQEFQNKIEKPLAKKDEAGNPVRTPDGGAVWLEGKEEEAKLACEEFGKEIFTLKGIRPLRLEDFEPVLLSADETELLEGIYVPPSES